MEAAQMKKLMYQGSLVAVAVGVAACLGSGGGGTPTPGPAVLNSGTYATSNAAVSPDGCGLDNSFYGTATVDVTVNGGSVDVDVGGTVLNYDVNGTTMHDPSSPGQQQRDCNVAGNCGAAALDCIVGSDIDFGGLVTGSNMFTLTDSYSFSVVSGAQCAQAATALLGPGGTFPCSSDDHADFDGN